SRKVDGPTIQPRNRINADSVEAVSTCLIKRKHLRIGFHYIEQEVSVTHPREPGFLLRLRHSRHVIGHAVLNPQNTFLRLGGERGLGKKFRPFRLASTSASKAARRAGDQAFGPKRLPVKEVA